MPGRSSSLENPRNQTRQGTKVAGGCAHPGRIDARLTYGSAQPACQARKEEGKSIRITDLLMWSVQCRKWEAQAHRLQHLVQNAQRITSERSAPPVPSKRLLAGNL